MAASKIEDFGEKIGGAKKDYYTKNGINVEDLKDLNHRQLLEYTIKTNVFKKFNYEELVNNGISKEVAFFIKRAYDKFPTKFKSTGDFEKDKEIAERYIHLGKLCENEFKKVKTLGDLQNIKVILLNEGYVSSSGLSYRLTEKTNNIDIADFFNKLRVSAWDVTKAEKKIEQTNFPHKQEAWRKGVYVKNYHGEISIAKTQGYHTTIIKDGFANEQEAEKYLLDVLKPELESKRKKAAKIEVRPQLKHIKRIGQSYRENKDITTDQFLNTFKFRGGEFGNWNTQLDRQQNLNLAYDSLLDLSKVLNVSPKTISLNGSLAIAFGSRGSGNALAHYEPGAVVINLTKMKGAGSLAHEWGHALDDFYGKLSGNINLNQFLSDGADERTSKVPETANLFKELIKALKTKELNADEIVKKYSKKVAEYKEKIEVNILNLLRKRYNLDTSKYEGLWDSEPEIRVDAIERLKRDVKKKPEAAVDFYERRYKNYESVIDECYERINNKEYYVGKEFGDTDFFAVAKLLDAGRKKPYWSTNKEMFARAFESYAQYKIEENGNRSDYLVHGTKEVSIYVRGREKDLIFPKIEELINSMVELDRSEVIKDNFTVVEDTYNNGDYKEEVKENIEEVLIDEEQEFIEAEIVDEDETKENINQEKQKKEDTEEIITEEIIVSEIVEEVEKVDALLFTKDEKEIVVSKELLEEGYSISLMHDKDVLDKVNVKTSKEVAEKMVMEGLSKEDIRKTALIEDVRIDGQSVNKESVISKGKISYKELKSKGDIYVIKIKNDSLEKINNLKQDYTLFKNGQFTNVVILKAEKNEAFKSLELINKEIGKIPYQELKKAPGMNHYILMNQEEFDKIKGSQVEYSAFEKGKNVNVVVKESSLRETLEIIGREYENTLGNTRYRDLKAATNGEMSFFLLDKKSAAHTMEKINQQNIKFSAFLKGDKINIAIGKKDAVRLNEILSKVKQQNSIER